MADIEKFIYYDNGSKKVLKPTDRMVIGSGGLAFEGATSNDFELQLTVTDPTEDRTINFPDEDGDIALLQGDALPKALSFPVKNPSGTTLTKGQLVYISGYDDTNGNTPEVSLAKSDSSDTMPAFGFVQNDIAPEAEGYVVYSGLFKGIDTNTNYSAGNTIYVSSTTAGAFQNTPPTGSNLIQNIGKIVKSHATNGEVLVGGAGRTNATPNLSEGKFFIGNASNQSSQSDYQLPTTLTNNAILVANSDGTSVLSTDLLTIDTANDRVGIGTSSPARTLHLVGDVQYEGSMRIDQYHTSADGPDVLLQKARGTVSTPTAVSEADELGKFVMYGHNGTSFLESAIIRSKATVDGSTYGGTLEFDTGTGGTTSNRLKIDESGVITFNGAYTFPTADGTANQILQTDGSGALSFATPTGISELVDDTTPQLGGNLDPNGFAISGHLLPSAVDTYDLGSSLAEWRDLYIGDSGRILFGNDSDIKLQHLPDTGLVLYLTQQTASKPKFILSNSANATSGAILTFHKDNAYDSDNDVVGKQEYLVAANAITTPDAVYVETSAIIKSNSDSFEEGKYDIKVSASGLLTTGLTVEPINNSSTPSVKISDNFYLPNSSVSEGEILKGSATSGETTFGKLSDTIMAELSIPGLDLQTDTNAFRFNCPVDIDIVGLDLYLDQHSTSGDVTVTVTNTTTSSSIQSLTISGTSLSANAYPYTTASAGDVITFAITATPANAQGLRAVLHIERKA